MNPKASLPAHSYHVDPSCLQLAARVYRAGPRGHPSAVTYRETRHIPKLDEMRRPVSKRDAFVTKLPGALEVQ
jgi:hypothetical protein